MHDDFLGCPVALSDPAAREDWNSMVKGVLAHSADAPVHLSRVLDSAPGLAIAHAARGLFCMLLGRREMVAVAAEAARTAQDAARAGDADGRTLALIGALDGMLARDLPRAIAALEDHLATMPRDTLAVKLGHAIRFLIGDAAGMRASVERVLGAHGPDHAARGYALGCHAFALEETGAYAAAERAGLAGLEHARDDAWGLHAVAHVHDMTHRPDDGIALIDRHRAAWDHCNNFRYHVWWHKALLHLDRGETDLVLSLYDTRIRAEKTDDYRDIANATSLLMRLALEGVAVGDRWEELAALAEDRTGDGCLVFADLHYMLALIGGDRAAAQTRLTAQLGLQAQGRDALAPIAAHPGRTAAAGLAAFDEGRYDRAHAFLDAALVDLPAIGGSHAQRDVFERMAVDAGLRAGRLDGAEAILRARTDRRAGHLDRFAETRMAQIAAARGVGPVIAAQ